MMTNHNFIVEQPDRVISFSVTSDEAKEAFDWLKIALTALRTAQPNRSVPPVILSELFGGFSAIAENRRYGGH
jgi:hypothetical protein